MPNAQRTRLIILFAAFLAVAFLVPAGVRLYTDWLWFREVDFVPVFSRELVTKGLLFTVVALVSFAFLYGNLWWAQRSAPAEPVILRSAPNAPPLDLTGAARRLSFAFAAVLALMNAGASMQMWLPLLQFLNATPFGSSDPVLGRDVGYYVFSLPVYAWLIAAVLSLAVLALAALITVYFVRGDVALLPRRIRVDPTAGMHLGFLVALVFLMVAVRTWLIRIPDLLFSAHETLQGANYVDVHARLPMLRISALIAVAGAAFVAFGALRRRVAWHAMLAAGGYVAFTAIAVGLYPSAIQRFVVDSNELSRERPQIASHIQATRHAWGLDAVEVRDITGEATLTLEDVRNNSPTIQNVRLWDRDPLLQTFGQLQEIRTYYDFVSVDDDRYIIDGSYRQVLLSPRELNTSSLPARNFINSHLTFTHGMGLTVSPVNQVTVEGLPLLFIKDLPPASTVSLTVQRPQIYFGELTNDYAIVGTKQAEFDFPSGESNVTTVYDGTAGVALSSLFRRAMFAIRFATLPILLSGDIESGSRIIYNRTIRERVRLALPFLVFDADPYMVLTEDGQLKWIMDAYTATSRYPYSFRADDGTNYMRNSAKVVVDAYDGSINAYISEPNDPLIQTLARVFPGTLQPLDNMPADLRAHIRYPEDLYRVQTTLYTVFHMLEPQTFYNKEDQWQLPTLDDGQGTARSPFMRYIVMRLPEEDHAEFIFMSPFTPRGKANLAAWMVARNDGEHYGKLVVYRFPKQSLVFGPRQVVNRIDQDTEIARQFSLWDQRGSQVIRGQLLVIPIEESLIYVQPIYLRAEGGRIPELKRVVVAYQNRVVMEETLDEGLSLIFGGEISTGSLVLQPGQTAPPPEFTAPTTAGAAADQGAASPLARQIQQAYDRAIAAQREGNWAEYGAQLQRLGDLIRQLPGTIPPN